MMYLSETMYDFDCLACGRRGDGQFHEMDHRSDERCCGACGSSDLETIERPATWWSVGVYFIDRSYGGLEEGGWWYDTGSLTDEFKVRGFEDIQEAIKYLRELSEFYKDELRPIGFTEQLPAMDFPSKKPYYS